MSNALHSGAIFALLSALLFGLSTPLSKWLLGEINPWLLAALLYLGSGLGLTLYRLAARKPWPRLPAGQWGWLAAAVVLGGGVAPVLLLQGLRGMPASSASLLLNAEGVLTALLAWFVFKENFDRLIAIGMACIVAGALVLSWPTTGVQSSAALVPALCVVAACLAWALDNNLTRKVALNDAAWIASIKGLVAGSVNLGIALTLDAGSMPNAGIVAAAMLLGFLAYGVSLTLFIVAMRHLGTARAGAYFSIAPFAGAVLAIPLLSEPVGWPLLAAATLMAAGVWLHVTEHHQHAHSHDATEHAHWHTHDAHHQHAHVGDQANDATVVAGHSHPHSHTALTHEHAHYPDAHHLHRH
jgi:drug/metabolite transporter (DMT)-like permease